MTVQKYRKMAQKRTIGNQKLKLGKNQNKSFQVLTLSYARKLRSLNCSTTAEKNRAVQSEKYETWEQTKFNSNRIT